MSEYKHFSAVDSNGITCKVTIVSGPVIFNENKVLLSMHDDPFWKFPGGVVDDAESLRATAIRECKEETGLDVILGNEAFVIVEEREGGGEKEYLVLNHYLGETLSVEINSNEEGVVAEWFDVNELPENCAPNIYLAIRHFLNIKK